MEQIDQKSKSLGKALKGKIKSLVRNISRENSISERDRNSSESETASLSSRESNREFSNKHKRRIRKLQGGTSDPYLSKSENCLSRTNSVFKRNASDSRLSERNTRYTQARYSQSTVDRKREDTELRDKGVQTCSTLLTTEYESDEIETQKPKTLNLKGAFGRRVRGSLRLMKAIRQKSESDGSSQGKRSSSEKYKLFRQLATSVLDSIQPPANLYLQPPTPLVVEDPPSTDDEPLHDLRKQNPAFLDGFIVAKFTSYLETALPTIAKTDSTIGQRPTDLPLLVPSFEIEPSTNETRDDATPSPSSIDRPPMRKQHSVACMTDPTMLCFVQGFESGIGGENGKLQIVRNKLLRKSRSSGNFGNTGPRSAPTTPQGQLGAPQGGLPEPLPSPTIQRSPSHSVFTKPDKTNLKILSTSTPAMTAQGQLAEPPSPKATKDPKVHTTSKWRQKKFLRHFPNVEEDEKVLNHYSCALIGDILLQGHLYITKNYFAFYSNVFGYVTKLLIPILTVEEITKEKTARIIPNAIGITTNEDKHIFGSLMSRDSTLTYMRTVWEKAKSEEALPEPEITEPDPDSSESIESGRESPGLENLPSGTDVLASAKFDRIRKESVRNQHEGSLLERKGSKGLIRTLKDAITEFRKLPRQSLILVATTLLLVLLFLSAAVLLYRVNKIQNQYSVSLQGATLSSTSEDIYSDLLQWQTHLHSRSADAVNNLLDNNLEQIAKVRQSLEALSTLLMGQSSTSSEDITTSSETENNELKSEPEPVVSHTHKNDS